MFHPKKVWGGIKWRFFKDWAIVSTILNYSVQKVGHINCFIKKDDVTNPELAYKTGGMSEAPPTIFQILHLNLKRMILSPYFHSFVFL